MSSPVAAGHCQSRARGLRLGVGESPGEHPGAALVATSEAVEIRRRLAGVNPAAFEPDLARGLWGFAWVRSAGQVDVPEALNAAEESVAILERLAERLPQAFTGDLRGALTTLAGLLDVLGRGDDATRVRGRIDRLG
ncbi:MAG: hypothetical protein ACRDRV_12180 [Pseudonocardiaceae bacterium]